MRAMTVDLSDGRVSPLIIIPLQRRFRGADAVLAGLEL
jgi:hypothetical protein